MIRPPVHERTYVFADGLRLELGKRTLIMGILNVTPDSFSDGGKYLDVRAAVERAKQMEDEGADIIDIGGESPRPGHEPVSLEEELRRVLPVIEAVRRAVRLPISIDTYKAETARRAMEAGAHIINDVWGFRRDPEIAAVAAACGCPVVLTHNRERPVYRDLMADVLEDLRISVGIARGAGVEDRNIWLDPGIGFAKEYEDNLIVMRRLDEIVRMGYPVLLGTSRKRFIRHTLGLPVDDVVEGTAATVALGIAQGCQIVRVHDVKQMKRVAAMADAIVYGPAAAPAERSV